MILLSGIAAAVAVALLRGGSFRNLGHVRIRWAGLALAALTLQLVFTRVLLEQTDPVRILFPLTHAAIVAVAWANRDLAGLRWLAIGSALNFVVMVANGGFMPMTPEVLVQAGLADSVQSVPLYTRVGFSKGLVLPGDEIALRWLGDTIALRPLRTIVSIGDVLMVPGIFLFVVRAMLHQEE